MGTQTLEIGKKYNVFSSRKGKFKIELTDQCETWASGIIIKGKAKAILKENEVEQGEEVTLRKELTTFTLVNK